MKEKDRWRLMMLDLEEAISDLNYLAPYQGMQELGINDVLAGLCRIYDEVRRRHLVM